MKKTMKRGILGALAVILLGLVITMMGADEGSGFAYAWPAEGATVYKSMNCGCCGIYTQYLQKEGLSVVVRNMDDMQVVKEAQGVPLQMRSCHTTKIGKYFIEGHVPTEAIVKLLEEEPDIVGIAMPGMPSGSPGMPGQKNEPWIVYAVHHDGTYEGFMRF